MRLPPPPKPIGKLTSAPNTFTRSRKAGFFALLTLCLSAAHLGAQSESGVLIYRQPATTYTEALAYRTFRQDNALYSTLITNAGERRQLKSGGVLALVPDPPDNFDSAFGETGSSALAKIAALESAYPSVRAQLEAVRAKWALELETFRRAQAQAPSGVARPAGPAPGKVPLGARLIRATAQAATVNYASGVVTLPLEALRPEQILALNATSRAIQLPLGLTQPAAPATPLPAEISSTTGRVELAGRKVIAFSARALGVPDRVFSVWTFFVVFPALLLLLSIALFSATRRPRVTRLQPAARPFSPP